MHSFALEHYKLLIVLGGSLLVTSFIISLLMVIQVLKPSYILSFITYVISLFGLTLSMYGIYSMITIKMAKRLRRRI
ncbi:MAG: hypothetical protein DRZ82_09150 [Thermoprotei archaeon]|nr:MAG: hypothetical protein DRZ82_09150 [Thermoprotei archaeon]